MKKFLNFIPKNGWRKLTKEEKEKWLEEIDNNKKATFIDYFTLFIVLLLVLCVISTI